MVRNASRVGWLGPACRVGATWLRPALRVGQARPGGPVPGRPQ